MAEATGGLSGSARVVGDSIELVLRLPVAGASRPGEPAAERGPDVRASADFASVVAGGVSYFFTPTQRAIVAALWHAREQGYEWVTQADLLEGADSNAGRLRDVFRGHPAWGTLIVSAHVGGGPLGSYRLAVPAG